jgi:hypothetical protein
MANKVKLIGRKIDEKMVAITKHGITYYVHVLPLQDTEGFIPELNTTNLRDKS